MVTKAKPLHLFVCGSLTRFTCWTAPNGPKSFQIRLSSVSGSKLYTNKHQLDKWPEAAASRCVCWSSADGVAAEAILGPVCCTIIDEPLGAPVGSRKLACPNWPKLEAADRWSGPTNAPKLAVAGELVLLSRFPGEFGTWRALAAAAAPSADGIIEPAAAAAAARAAADWLLWWNWWCWWWWIEWCWPANGFIRELAAREAAKSVANGEYLEMIWGMIGGNMIGHVVV